ncbi:unnamed protein product [Prunus armeniaca]|uniref:Uncharacterized protein n=1 Tax=Prunus armeniaca TaxID=36596 RepID=A0A6J5VK96_PRUAR|nr:unnamed protein product [Prunus armeniaca]
MNGESWVDSECEGHCMRGGGGKGGWGGSTVGYRLCGAWSNGLAGGVQVTGGGPHVVVCVRGTWGFKSM